MNTLSDKNLFYKTIKLGVLIFYIVYFIILGYESKFKLYYILYPAILIGIIDGRQLYLLGDKEKSKITFILVGVAILIIIIFKTYVYN